jgi:hypothetical protein
MNIKMIESFVNYECKITLTYLDQCKCTDNLRDILYIRSPRRLDTHTLRRCKLKKEDELDKIPNKYIFDLKDYTHFLFVKSYRLRLKKYFYKNVKDREVYSVTANNFPQKPVIDFDDFIEFVEETYPDNLHHTILPYKCLEGDTDFYKLIRYEHYENDIKEFFDILNVPIVPLLYCESNEF